jgi:O-antigen/teichoic acid export membrane protein
MNFAHPVHSWRDADGRCILFALMHDETAQPASARPILNELAGKASTSAAWTILSHGGGQIVRLASNLIVTRLLFAEYFGLMALVNVFLLGLELFSDIGIGPALVQSKRDDPDFVNTVWTLQVVRGLALCSIAMFLAVPFADFYEQPVLVSLIRVTALSAVIQGFASPAIFTQMRELRLKRPEILQFGTQVVGAVVTVAVAGVTRSIWSLVVGGIVSSMLRTVLSHVWLPGIRSRFRFDREAARYVRSFGSWIFSARSQFSRPMSSIESSSASSPPWRRSACTALLR